MQTVHTRIWAVTFAHTGRAFAYMLTTTTGNPKMLERQARASVRGDSHAGKFTPVRASAGSWSPPGDAFAIHVRRVLRFLVKHCPKPPTLHPGCRFGASGGFAPVLTNALAILRRERPCQGEGHQRTRERARELSPDVLGEVMRVCLWCGLPVPGRAWRHRHCSTRRWRAQCALRSELSPEDYDGFLYRADFMAQQGMREPEAMQRAFLEFAGKDAALPRGFRKVITLPRESVGPGRRAPIALRMKNRGERHD